MNIQISQYQNSTGVIVTNKYIQYSDGEKIEIPKKIRRKGSSQTIINGEVYINNWHYNRKKKQWEQNIK